MRQRITRIALVAVVVLSIFAASALVVTADPDIPTEPVPPMDPPGPRVAFWLTRMPELVFVDGEEFQLKFNTFPITGAVLVWNVDISTYMTLGSQFDETNSLEPDEHARLSTILFDHGIIANPDNPGATLQSVWRDLSETQRALLLGDLDQLGFRYEPWASSLDMLQGFWTETGLCDGMLALVSGPGGSRLVHQPCLPPRESTDALVEHGPTGWYEFSRSLTETLDIAAHYAEEGFPVEVFVVNRGPLLDVDRNRIPEMIDMARANGIRVNVVPTGNEPGPRMRFPFLKPLRDLAEGTGGLVYYEPNLENPYDYSMLPEMVPQMMREFYGRMGQIDSGTLVAPRASLVLAPSEHVEIISPSAAQSAAANNRVRIDFENLTIGEPRSTEIRLRVSTNITQTLLPVFRGSTDWADRRHSYFEWFDRAGQPHRIPIPQRVISVTTGTVQSAVPSPTPTETPLPAPSPTPTETALPAPSPTTMPTSTPTHTSSPTLTPTATSTATATPTSTATATATPTSTPTATPTTTPSPTATATPVPPTPAPTATQRARAAHHHHFYLSLIAQSRGSSSRVSYPPPQSEARVEVPVLDALLRRLFANQ